MRGNGSLTTHVTGPYGPMAGPQQALSHVFLSGSEPVLGPPLQHSWRRQEGYEYLNIRQELETLSTGSLCLTWGKLGLTYTWMGMRRTTRMTTEKNHEGVRMEVWHANPLSVVPETHMGTSSSPSYSISDPIPCLWPAKAVQHSPRSLNPAVIWETWRRSWILGWAQL